MAFATKAALSWASRVPASFMPEALLLRLLAERERWILWLPVGIGAGIGIYFALPFEPPRGIGLVAFALSAIGAWIQRGRAVVLVAMLATMAVTAGLALAGWRTARIEAPVVEERIGPVTVLGRVADVDRTERGYRILLDFPWIQGLSRSKVPARLRIGLRPGEPAPEIGSWIRVRAVVSPPGAPLEPGGFDFARYAFFRQIGGLGYATGAVTARDAPFDPGFSIALELRRWQAQLTARIEKALPGPAGAVAAALLTGERSGIPEDVNTAMQLSGLAHLLSISGLHLALVAGIVFFVVRLSLAAIERVALRYPIKKIAALVALVAAFAYMLISGAAVPTQRSFLMTALVLTAVMLDRTALSMRVVALAAIVVLALQPDAVLEAGFQMSFAAVVALIAVYEGWGARLLARSSTSGLSRRVLLWAGGIALTSAVAGTSSGLYALFHFNRFVHYGVIANLVVDPLTAFWVMPLGLLGFLLMPFGLESLALVPMGWGLDALIWVAQEIAGWPAASSAHPALPAWSLTALTLGGLWLCLWTTAWRWWGLLPILAALVPLAIPDLPDIRIDGEGRVVALRAADGGLLVSTRRSGRFATDAWSRRDGGAEIVTFPVEGASRDGRLRCDAEGCLWRNQGFVVALPRKEAMVGQACGHADIVIATFDIAGRCAGARLAFDRRDLARDGSYAIRLRSSGRVMVETVAGERGDRPWTRSGHGRDEP